MNRPINARPVSKFASNSENSAVPSRASGVSRCGSPQTNRTGKAYSFDYQRLAKAIETRERCYRLLMWISDAIDDGLIQPRSSRHGSGGADAAVDWLRYHFELIPEEVRPDENDIAEFGAFFSTFLTSSFDIVEKPGTRGEGPSWFGCQCELCLRIVNAPHLQTKKLYARDKRRANFLMSECLLDFAKEHGLLLTEERSREIVANESTRRSTAYLAYGHWLIRRLAGDSDGPAVLALWRLIAWDPRGGMRRGFTLQLSDFKTARRKLVALIESST